MSSCRSCNELAVEKMDMGEMVCTACGFVNDDVVFAAHNEIGAFCSTSSNANLLRDQTAPTALKRRTYKSASHSYKICLNMIKNLSAQCNLGRDKVIDIEILFKNLHDNRFKHQRQQFKCILAGCCVYSVLKNQKLDVPTTEFCDSVGCSIPMFLSVYSKVKKFVCPNDEPQSREDHIRSLLKGMPKDTLDERMECHKLSKHTAEILNFLDQCWILSGRSTEASIIAASFFAWKNLDVNRWRMPFNYYYDLMKFKARKKASKDRVGEIKLVLLKLAEYIPLINKSNIKKNNVCFFLKELLEYQDYVLNTFCSSDDACDDEEIKKYKSFRRQTMMKPGQSVNVDNELTPDVNSYCSESELIPETDWKIYIRSPEEVEIIKQFKEKNFID